MRDTRNCARPGSPVKNESSESGARVVRHDRDNGLVTIKRRRSTRFIHGRRAVQHMACSLGGGTSLAPAPLRLVFRTRAAPVFRVLAEVWLHLSARKNEGVLFAMIQVAVANLTPPPMARDPMMIATIRICRIAIHFRGSRRDPLGQVRAQALGGCDIGHGLLFFRIHQDRSKGVDERIGIRFFDVAVSTGRDGLRDFLRRRRCGEEPASDSDKETGGQTNEECDSPVPGEFLFHNSAEYRDRRF